MSTVLVWAFRTYVLDMYECGSLDEALRVTMAASGQGSEALDCIEVIEDDGTHRVLQPNEVMELWRRLRDAEPPRPKPQASILIHPPGERRPKHERRYVVDWYPTFGVAEKEAARLRSVLGDDRVEGPRAT